MDDLSMSLLSESQMNAVETSGLLDEEPPSPVLNRGSRGAAAGLGAGEGLGGATDSVAEEAAEEVAVPTEAEAGALAQEAGLPDDSWTSSVDEDRSPPPPPATSPFPPPPAPFNLSTIPETSLQADEQPPVELGGGLGGGLGGLAASQLGLGDEDFGDGAGLMEELDADEALVKSFVEEEPVWTEGPGMAALGSAGSLLAQTLRDVAAAEGWTPPGSADASQHASSLFATRTEPLGDPLSARPVPSPGSARPHFGQPLPPSPPSVRVVDATLPNAGAEGAAAPTGSSGGLLSAQPSIIDELPSSRMSGAISYHTQLDFPLLRHPSPARLDNPNEFLTEAMRNLSLHSPAAWAQREASQNLMSTPMVADGSGRPSIPLSAVPGMARNINRVSYGGDGSYLGLPTAKGAAERSAGLTTIGEGDSEAQFRKALAEAPTEADSSALLAALNFSKAPRVDITQPHDEPASKRDSLVSLPSHRRLPAISEHLGPAPTNPQEIKIRSNVHHLVFEAVEVGTTKGKAFALQNASSYQAVLQFMLKGLPTERFKLEVAADEAGTGGRTAVALTGGKTELGPQSVAHFLLHFAPGLAEVLQGTLVIRVASPALTAAFIERTISLKATGRRIAAKKPTRPLGVQNGPARPSPLVGLSPKPLLHSPKPLSVQTLSNSPKPMSPRPRQHSPPTKENAPPAEEAESEASSEAPSGLGSGGLLVKGDGVCLGVLGVGESKTVRVALGNGTAEALPLRLFAKEESAGLAVVETELGPRSFARVPLTFRPSEAGPFEAHVRVQLPRHALPKHTFATFPVFGYALPN